MDIIQNEEELSPQESLKLIGKVLNKVQDDALWRVAKKRALKWMPITEAIFFLKTKNLKG